MLNHPDRELLDALTADLDTALSGTLLHVLRCEQCAAAVEMSLEPPETRRGLFDAARRPVDVDYSAVWKRIEERNREAAEALAKEREKAEPLLRALLLRPPEERDDAVRREQRFQSWVLADLLLSRARQAGDDREDLARLALAIAESLGPESHADRLVEDLRLAARCEIAEALRARRDLAGAEAELGRAAALAQQSSDNLERARFCRSLAALRADQGRVDEALGLLHRAVELFEEVGALAARARALVDSGFLSLEAGEARRALATFDRAAALSRHLTPALACRTAQGTALSLALEGRIDEAMQTLEGARIVYLWTPDTREGLDLLSLEGRIALGAGRPETAKNLLTPAFQGLVQRQDPAAALRAGIHLSRALLRTGSPRAQKELRELAHQIQSLLTSPDLPDEIRGALSPFFEEAAAGAAVDPSQLEAIEESLVRRL